MNTKQAIEKINQLDSKLDKLRQDETLSYDEHLLGLKNISKE